MGYVVIQRIQEFQAFEMRDTVKMDDGFTVIAGNGEFVLQTANNIRHF